MKEGHKILIVDSHLEFAESLKTELSSSDFNIIGIVSGCEKVIVFVREFQPDIILMDIEQGERPDGISTIKAIRREFQTPVIYLSSEDDGINFSRAKSTFPSAYIMRPFKLIDLRRAIELAIENNRRNNQLADAKVNTGKTSLPESIYFRKADKMIKIQLADIHYIEANRNYCKLFLKGRQMMILITMKQLDKKLPKELFLRVHRSFIININQIEEIASNHILVGEKFVPFNKLNRPALMNRIFSV